MRTYYKPGTKVKVKRLKGNLFGTVVDHTPKGVWVRHYGIVVLFPYDSIERK